MAVNKTIYNDYGNAERFKAFTLIEILVVVVILSIAAAMAIPMLSSAADIQVKSAANVVASDLEYAKSMAITNSQTYCVDFDPTAETYSIKNNSGTIINHPVKGSAYTMDFSSDNRLNRVDIYSVDFNSNAQVYFDSMGSPDNGGTIELRADGNIITINVEPITGFISITN
jgi:prepilin-type N-terminal cleavage/methylation domain-containing protein